MSEREKLCAELARVVKEGLGLEAYAGAKVAVLDCQKEEPQAALVVIGGGVHLL